MSALDAVMARGRVYLLVGLFMLGFGAGIAVKTAGDRLVAARAVREQLAQERDRRERELEDARFANHAAAHLVEQMRADDQTITDLQRRLANAHTPVVAEAPPAGCSPPGDAHLSLGAQRLYDAAASGDDLPAGACGADGAADAACAAPSGTTLDAFHGVATENASRQRDCTARLNALIDLLTVQGRGAAAAASAP